MERILFVDDDPNVLQGLQRMLRSMRQEWEMAFAESGQKALEILASQPFDVIVSDMRMPGMSGVQLLTEVRQRHPYMVRIILSGQSDQESVLRSVGPSHQYLSKPCEAETLKSTVARAFALRDLLTSEPLQRLVSQMATLPSVPALYCEITSAMQSPDSSLTEIGAIISKDVAMTAKILQIVNSAFFGLPRTVTSPAQAVSLIGLDTVRSLVLAFGLFSQFEGHANLRAALEQTQRHSLVVGKYAAEIVKEQKLERQSVEDALTAGMLHDAGELALLANGPKEYAAACLLAKGDVRRQAEIERDSLGAEHAEVGAYLLGLWGLPNSIVETTAFHHAPMRHPAREFCLVTAVHVADALAHEVHSEPQAEKACAFDTEYLAALGLENQLPVWREACLRTEMEKDKR